MLTMCVFREEEDEYMQVVAGERARLEQERNPVGRPAARGQGIRLHHVTPLGCIKLHH